MLMFESGSENVMTKTKKSKNTIPLKLLETLLEHSNDGFFIN